ncbi:MAG: hypothetical protein WB587_13835 [Nitrososphaeraceae archaeon]
MKSTLTLILAMLTIATIVGMVTTSVKNVYAPRECPGCAAFKKLTHEFEKNVINSIGDPNKGPQPHLRELFQSYSQDVRQLFVGDSNIDQVRTLLQSYEQNGTTIFDQQPPEPE